MADKVAIIVQARMGSSRLPGKVLMPVVGKPMLALQLERLKRCRSADTIVLAIPDTSQDLPLAEFARTFKNVGLFQGSEDDVLARYHGAALQVGADCVVRVTSDCPLIDPELIDSCIRIFLENPADYVSNCQQRTYPRGLDTEVFSFEALDLAFKEARAQPEREHVTPFIWRQPGRFKRFELTDTKDYSHLRWTVDTLEDYELVSWVYETLYSERPEFGYDDILALVMQHPEWQRHNLHVQQKPYGR